MKRSIIATLMFLLTLAGTAVAQDKQLEVSFSVIEENRLEIKRSKDSPIHPAVESTIQYNGWNFASMILLQKEKSVVEKYKETIKAGSKAADDAEKMLGRMMGRPLTPNSSHKIVIVRWLIEGGIAKVETLETTEWYSGDMLRFSQYDASHTYTLELINGRWLVVSDEFPK